MILAIIISLLIGFFIGVLACTMEAMSKIEENKKLYLRNTERYQKAIIRLGGKPFDLIKESEDYGETSDKEALEYAISIIENYQLEIKLAKKWINIDLVKKGFCQGSVFINALIDIEKRR